MNARNAGCEHGSRCRMIRQMKTRNFHASLGALLMFCGLSLTATAGQVAPVPPEKCVTMGKPKLNVGYMYREADSSGGVSLFTDRWEQFTATGSQVMTKKTGGPAQGTIKTVNRHRIVKGLYLLDGSSQAGTSGGSRIDNSSIFVPAIVADSANPVCEKRSWPIRASKVTNTSAHGTFSATSDAGTLFIISVHEVITVPAGKFDTVHSKRVMNTARGVGVDEYWKSIEHGVTVKRIHTYPGGSVTATPQSIKP